MQNEQELNHYGVKGMKWGVRKAQVAATYIKKHTQKPTTSATRESLNKEGQARWDKNNANLGKKSADRIERRIAKGSSPTKSQMIESGRFFAKTLGLTIGAAVIGDIGATGGDFLVKPAIRYTVAGAGWNAGRAYAAYGRAMAPKALNIVGPTAKVIKLGKDAWSITG